MPQNESSKVNPTPSYTPKTLKSSYARPARLQRRYPATDSQCPKSPQNRFAPLQAESVKSWSACAAIRSGPLQISQVLLNSIRFLLERVPFARHGEVGVEIMIRKKHEKTKKMKSQLHCGSQITIPAHGPLSRMQIIPRGFLAECLRLHHEDRQPHIQIIWQLIIDAAYCRYRCISYPSNLSI